MDNFENSTDGFNGLSGENNTGNIPENNEQGMTGELNRQDDTEKVELCKEEDAADTKENGFEDSRKQADSENEAQYGFASDGTYRFVPDKEKVEENEYRNANTQYPYGQQSGRSQSYYPYSNNTGRYGNVPPDNRGGYYRDRAYPYSSERTYAYDPSQNQPKKQKNGSKIFAIIAGSLCVILAVALIYIVTKQPKTNSVKPEKPTTGSSDEATTINENVDDLMTQESPESSDAPNELGEMSAKAIYKKVLNSSVGILVYGKNDSVASEGSGILYKEDKDGKYTYIITCAHVISDKNSGIVVQLADETEYTAEVVGFDTRTDIGVLRIAAKGLQLADIGDSSKLSVGDTVYAIGNPGGVEFANSFTCGMVSALDRPVNSTSSGYTMECIQHTAAINPGNSGGALINVFGQVIGVNSMKIVDDEYEGMGFSVPSSVFTNIVNELVKNGYVANRPKLGITYVSASSYNSYGMFVALKGLPSGSIVIYSISENSALSGTEAKEGDLIVAVNGKDLDSSSTLSALVESSKVGDVLTLKLVRINKDYSYEEFTVKATLIEDRGDVVTKNENTTENDYGDYFNDFFDRYFGENSGY